MRTVYWLGAHKTGTTFLQKSLDLSQIALRSRKVFYMELEEFRTKYSRPLLNENAPPPAPIEFNPPETRLNLIFDENIAGYVQHALRPRRFYPKVTERVDRVAKYLGLVPDEVVFGIRSYEGYLPSLYCETLKSTPFQTFDEFLAKSFAMPPGDPRGTPTVEQFVNMNCAALIGRLARHFSRARIRVYFYESVRGNEAALLSTVTGIPARELELIDGDERPGFSGRAVEALHELAEKRSVRHEDVVEATREYPKSESLPSFNPFDDRESEILRRRYRDDCERIRNNDRVEIIDFA